MNTTPVKLLIAEDEVNLSFVLQKELSRQGWNVTVANNGDEAVEMARWEEFNVALLDLMMPGRSGIEVMKALRESEPAPEVIIMTGHATVNSALEAMKFGAYDYLTKPCSLSQVTEVIRKAYEKNRLCRENLVLQSLVKHQGETSDANSSRYGIITGNQQMINVLAKVESVASNTLPVLIQGESGTGKKAVARAIHNASARRNGPFVTLDCASTPQQLLEVELFGCEAGSFGAAAGRKLGLFELAGQGTLFLDNACSLTPYMQGRLHEAIKNSGFCRIGGSRRVNTDVRVVVASSQDFEYAVRQGTFRQDLYNLISSMRLAIPSLRERKEDIVALADHFLKVLAPNRQLAISPEARTVLNNYGWPGNIRELHNVMERAVLLARSNVIEPCDLLVELSGQPAQTYQVVSGGNNMPLALGMDHGQGSIGVNAQDPSVPRLQETERREILAALERNNWHQGKTAELLGISPSTLYRRLREYKITKRMVRAQRANAI